MNDAQIARAVGDSPASVKRLLAELERAGVFSRDGKGAIFSRRMERDERLRETRADCGRLGGNPSLLNKEDKQKVNHSVKQSPTPSSSSSSSSSSSTSVVVPTPSASEPPKSKTLAPRAKKPPDDAPKTNAVWQAYSDAYRERYGVDPTRNAKANGLLSGFVDRIGAEEAPAVAAFFLQSNRQLYVAATHALDLLIRDAEGLRTAWVTHRHGTESEARMIDKTQGRGNVFGKLIKEVKSGAKG